MWGARTEGLNNSDWVQAAGSQRSVASRSVRGLHLRPRRWPCRGATVARAHQQGLPRWLCRWCGQCSWELSVPGSAHLKLDCGAPGLPSAPLVGEQWGQAMLLQVVSHTTVTGPMQLGACLPLPWHTTGRPVFWLVDVPVHPHPMASPSSPTCLCRPLLSYPASSGFFPTSHQTLQGE